jgi:hypothetical protein
MVFLVNPGFLAHAGVEFSGPGGAVEIRAFHGGLELGIAAFLGVCAFRSAWHRVGLFAQIAMFGGLASGRLVGMALDPAAIGPLMTALTAAEGLGVAVGLLALRRVPFRLGSLSDRTATRPGRTAPEPDPPGRPRRDG